MIDRLIKIPSEAVINEQIEQMDTELMKELMQFHQENKINFSSMCWMGMSTDGIVDYNYLTTKGAYESCKLMNDFSIPKWMYRNERVYALKDSHKKKLLQKRKLYERFAFFIPDNLYQNVCEQIAGTDYDFRESRFMDAARIYRNVLIDYVRSKNGFGYTFFTPMPESEMRDNGDDYSQAVKDKYCNRQFDNIFIAVAPRFAFFHPTKIAVTWMVLLVSLNLVLCGLSIAVCNKFLTFK
jgi:hypothetical protein